MSKKRTQILLTNDDGIHSPGLWAAAEALAELGYVTVVAPREQYSGAGRSYPLAADGSIESLTLQIKGQSWPVFAVNGSPAQTVMHALLEILPEKPDLVVSGINYGENVGSGITVSGTIGAALEAAAFGIPALASSLQLLDDGYLNNSHEVDFNTAAYFTGQFARMMLEKQLPEDVQIFKLEVPASATPQTEWRMTRLGMHRYYVPRSTRQSSLAAPGKISYTIGVTPQDVSADSDIYALAFDQKVAVTPLSLDLTSRVDLNELEALLRNHHS